VAREEITRNPAHFAAEFPAGTNVAAEHHGRAHRNMELSMQLIFTPLILRPMENRKRA